MSKLTPYIDKHYIQSSTANGTLDGFTFAVKDVLNLKAHTNSLGNPLWQETHEVATKNAHAVQLLLDAGATVQGITITDEFMYSLKGENRHYGSPLNPIKPTSFTGGSSSGSASAVALSEVDFALGTDTGGSVRIPSSYCGLFGIRPTHTKSLLQGVAPLSQSFDTIGVLSKSLPILATVADVVYPYATTKLPAEIYCLTSAFERLTLAEQTQLKAIIPQQMVHSTSNWSFANDFSYETLLQTYKTIQAYEAWENYGSWMSAHMEEATLQPDIYERFKLAEAVLKTDYEAALIDQTLWTHYFEQVLANHVILLPTAIGEAIEKSTPTVQVDHIRQQTMQLTCLAGLAGVPQLSIPVILGETVLGLSLIGPRNSEQALIELAKQFN